MLHRTNSTEPKAAARRPHRILGLAIVIALVYSVGAAYAVFGSETGEVYYACVNNSSGTIKMVSESDTCAGNEVKVVWNQQGPQGEPGPKGDPGEQGPPGPPGPPGGTESVDILEARIESLESQVTALQDAVGELGTETTRLDIDDVEVYEGDSGTTEAVFTVTRSGSQFGSVSVDYSTTAAGSDVIHATPDEDFVTTSGTLNFGPDETEKTITVMVNGDTDLERREFFYVDLSNPLNADLAKARGFGYIGNDDPPEISIYPAQCSGDSMCEFEVRLSTSTNSPVSVDYATSDGTAEAGTHYRSTSGALFFSPGSMLRTIQVKTETPTFGATGSRQFTVSLSNPVNATIATGQATGTINY